MTEQPTQKKQNFTAKELTLINFSLILGEDFKPIIIPYDKLPMAGMIASKMKKHTEPDLDETGKQKKDANGEPMTKFIDGEIEFTTEEKSFILSKTKRGWPLADGEIAVSVENKLQ